MGLEDHSSFPYKFQELKRLIRNYYRSSHHLYN